MRVRPRVIGAVLIAGGFVSHLAFEVWAAPYAGRGDMGQFACFEFTLFAAGLGLVFLSLASARPVPGVRPRATEWLVWSVVALAAIVAVVSRLPP